MFTLQTNASDRGVGAVLSQTDENGQEHPVAYFSRKREAHYSTVEKECLVATHAFRVYLLGRKFVIQTDHRAMEWLNRLKDNNARLTRWSLALQPYDFSVHYRTGTANGNADALSRAFTADDTTSSQGPPYAMPTAVNSIFLFFTTTTYYSPPIHPQLFHLSFLLTLCIREPATQPSRCCV